ncbi:hypothetical protein bsdcttw_14470 [Anaerocolumna chitinilytica]|uniref:Uncharacterized protein n=1 Tax=Anaerocolumna chitinilytica TaxID=1727145 RepID=A0A7I8DQ52_9FIRM|nr:hypothetical protein bsdcttw_14470 [Anaerocolumna chitinilytica]
MGIVLILPIINLYISNPISEFRVCIILILSLEVKVIIAVTEIKKQTIITCFSDNKIQWYSMLALACILGFYINIGLIPINMKFGIYSPHLAYYGYLCYYFKKKRD